MTEIQMTLFGPPRGARDALEKAGYYRQAFYGMRPDGTAGHGMIIRQGDRVIGEAWSKEEALGMARRDLNEI